MKILSKSITLFFLFNTGNSFNVDISDFDKFDFIRMVGGFLNGYGLTNISDAILNIDPEQFMLCGN